MTFSQHVDLAVFQRDDADYFRTLKHYGASGAFIQLTYGVGFPNKKAKNQIANCSKILDFTGAYAFFLGNPVAEAKEFLAYLHNYGLDRTTPVMLDVEPNESYNGPQTNLINEWSDIIYKDGYHNIFIYSMASWLKDGYHIKPENLKHGRIWAAAYGTSEPGVVNTSIWQYTDNWCGLNTDGNYNFLPLSVMTGANAKVVKKPKVQAKVEKPTYAKHGHTFMVVGTMANGYSDIDLKTKKGTHLTRGSVVDGVVKPYGSVTRILTDSGYFSGNTKIMKAIG